MMNTISFESLIAPLSLHEFIQEYWGKKPLLLRGDPNRFKKLFSLERYLEQLERPFLPSMVARAVFDRKGNGDVDPQIPVASSDVLAAYKSGATICINRFDDVVPELAQLCQDTKRVLGYPGAVNVHTYYSPNDAGFTEHFDARIATTLQIDGSKTWRYSATPAVEWPHGNAFLSEGRLRYYEDITREEWEAANADTPIEWHEVTLHPGDILCLPAGVWHSASAQGSSLACNLHFNSMEGGEYLGKLLNRHFHSDARWRCVPPLFERERPSLRGTVSMGQLIEDAIAYLGQLKSNPVALSAAIATVHIAGLEGPETSKAIPLRPDVPNVTAEMILPTTTIALGPLCFIASPLDAATLVLVANGNKIEAPNWLSDLIRRVVLRRSLAAGDLLGVNPSWSELQDAIAELTNLGVFFLSTSEASSYVTR